MTFQVVTKLLRTGGTSWKLIFLHTCFLVRYGARTGLLLLRLRPCQLVEKT